ncbi:hypothetical protein M3610_00755 [Neobacillus sp. MER 74]|nr:MULTISPECIES: hypothetical protein [Bacillaceae]MCM3113822.1 hypothetical protein [Neobacillus sp. MER 74]
MYSWIYSHFINTGWFVITVFSIPLVLLAFLLYFEVKQHMQNNDGSQNQ